MRTLIVMRGAPGTGKSTTIKKLGLDQHTLSSDAIRLLYSSPRLGKEGYFVISAHNDKKVWEDFFRILDMRMQQGELIVVDATHTQAKEMRNYNKLAQKYRYRIGCIDFSQMPIDQVHRQNKQRPVHQIVPKEAVQRLYDRCASSAPPKNWTVFHWDDQNQYMEKIQNWLKIEPIDLSMYKKIHHIGDIQGCYTALASYLPKTLPKDEFFIFIGDICDRGSENGRSLSLMMKLIELPNVRVLYGNHEVHIENWSLGTEIRSGEVIKRTIPQWEEANIAPSDLHDFISKIDDLFVYHYQEKYVVVTHAGLSTAPEDLHKLAAKTAHNGVGDYGANIDKIFSEIAPQGWFQIHGHRNSSLLDIDSYPRSFNLEGRVEFGGALRILVLEESGFTPIYVSNPLFRSFSQLFALGDGRIKKLVEAQWVSNSHAKVTEQIRTKLENHPYINIKNSQLHPNIHAYNFSRDAFLNSKWDELSIRARGLFIHQKTQEIVARSYDKFFNIGERQNTRLEALENTLQFPIQVFAKENGFLGILGYDTEKDALFFASKSTPEGPFAECFRRIFEQSLTNTAKEYILQYLKETHSSMVFEVIDPEFDPHIISYDTAHIVLLDIIRRSMTFENLDHKKLISLAKKLSLQVKDKAYHFQHWRQFAKWYKQTESYNYTYKGNNIEGFVIQDANQYMVKIKLEYYRFWKSMRSLKDRVRKIRGTDKPLKKDLSNPRAKSFYEWCTQCSDATLEQDIISLREKFESGWQDSYIPPSKIDPKIQGFTQALNNLEHQTTIKENTAEQLLKKAQEDLALHAVLVDHTIFQQLINSASIETKERWNKKIQN
ncbi:MAG: hypothetical protein CL916_03355 [Deltaproteobacteria bacterium]|nr:hypothetical protein [Deltaproteobacteria bacterium]